MKYRRFTAALLGAFASLCMTASPTGGAYRQGVRLYEKGLYERAAQVLSQVEAPDAMSEGYALLCAGQMHSPDFDELVSGYERQYGETALSPRINWLYAGILFDEGRFDETLYRLGMVPRRSLSYKEYTEKLFKTAYSRSGIEDYEGAAPLYDEVISRRKSPYTAPSWYAKGYIQYRDKDFGGAFDSFEQASEDERFSQQAAYYMLECRFLQKNYDYVVANASAIYEAAPSQRRQHLARIISESYLVKGDVARAERYYADAVSSAENMTRADFFYAGSLQYALEHYKDAISNFEAMKERTDSIGQIASYQMGYSFIQTKDKVSALEAFRQAAALSFDPQIKEDAMLNQAKLAFDLNQDASVFESYMAAYPLSGKHDMIYDYMAVASLLRRDYAAAIDAYDHIDDLTPEMKGNYMRANYLRAEQLVSGGSWREAQAPLKAAAAYSAKTSPLSKLSRYWLAESYFKTEDYQSAGTVYTELYNTSSLDRRPEGKALPYNIAYCYMGSGDYASAVNWFDKYLSGGESFAREDAMIRRGDCFFYRQQYKEAAAAYGAAIDAFPSSTNIYPYYRQGLSYGFAGSAKAKAEALSKVVSAPADTPLYAEAVYELGRTYVALKQEANAVQTFETLIARSPDSSYVARSLVELGMINRNAGRYDKALESYKQVVSRFPDSESAEGALLAIESIYQQRGEPDLYLAYVESIGKGPGTDTEKEQMMFNSAEQIFLTENYDRALTTLARYIEMYPQGAYISKAYYYTAECYKAQGHKEKACTWYAKVIDLGVADDAGVSSITNYASLSYSLERYADAFEAYRKLAASTSSKAGQLLAAEGMMRSAYALKRFDAAVSAADAVLSDEGAGTELKRNSSYIKAKSLLSTSRREEAYAIFTALAAEPSTAEGAEASYLLIQDVYDRGRFDEVEDMVYKFSASAGGQYYWLAKAFIVLGDAFMENGNVKQARATFESLRDGYRAGGPGDDVPEAVKMRLSRIDQMQ